MQRPTETIDERDLERELLRKGVGALRATAPHCADCGRTPLTGELVHRFPRGETVCELCRPLRRTVPEGTETVRHSERGLTVRVTQRAA
jgi:hypothetical protein